MDSKIAQTKIRPTIGLALSGAATKSIFYIGFLESIKESGLEIDYIAASSGATIPAASFACGSIDALRDATMDTFDKSYLFSLLQRSNTRGGYYTLDKVEEAMREFTGNLSFEQVKPNLGFVAVDLHQGEQVVLSMGDIARAARISCTVPGVFEPVRWGSRVLIDGGLLNIIPGDVARGAGMDIVLGVNLRGNFHIFEPSFMSAKKALNALKKVLLLNKAATLWHQLFQALEQTNFLPYYSDYAGAEDFGKHPGIFSVLGRSLDLAIEAVKHDKHLEEQNYYCDILLRPNIPSVSPADFTQKKELYEIGRKAGWEAVRKLEAEVLVRSRAAVQEKEVVF